MYMFFYNQCFQSVLIVGGGSVGQAAVTIATKVTNIVYVATETNKMKLTLKEQFPNMKENIIHVNDIYGEILRQTYGQGIPFVRDIKTSIFARYKVCERY